MEKDFIYELALSKIKGISAVHAKRLIDHFGSARVIFHASPRDLAECGKTGMKALPVTQFKAFHSLEKEIRFLEKYAIQPLFITNKKYPQRLLNNADAPCLLFYKGNADLNTSKIIAIIGTRSPTEYGISVTEGLIKELQSSGALIVSGLAYGIDTVAHTAALRYNLPTIGILAHGLDRIYPPENTQLAKDMLLQGGLLTGFCSGNDPEIYHFPIRNRIVAGISDAVVVTETREKGGSQLTVQNAHDYGKKIFAVPGRVSDARSAGCNTLIRKNKAILFTDAKTMLEEMLWTSSAEKSSYSHPAEQTTIFPSASEPVDLTEDEKSVFQLLKEKKKLDLDELCADTGISFNKLALPLLSLEWKNLIIARPGRIYCIRE